MKVQIAPDFRDLFRPLTDSELEHAKENNRSDPNHERVPPIAVWQCGKEWILVDGHHTLKIRENMRINGKPAKIRYHKMEFTDRETAKAYAIQVQLGRRNLDPSQISIALAKLPKAKPGPKSQSELPVNLPETPSREELAAEHGISDKTLRFADKVNDHGAKAIKDAVAAGDVSVSDAASIVDLPKKEQSAALKKVKQGESKTLKAAKQDTPADLAKKNRTLAKSLIDKAIRATDDLHQVKPNRSKRDKTVKMLQEAGGLLW